MQRARALQQSEAFSEYRQRRVVVDGEQGRQRVYGIHAIRPDGSGERLISDVGEVQLAARAPDD